MLNVIKLTGRACFVVHAKPGTCTRDGETVPVADLAQEIAAALSAATGASAVVVPDDMRIDLVDGEPAPVAASLRPSALEALGLPPSWADGCPHEYFDARCSLPAGHDGEHAWGPRAR